MNKKVAFPERLSLAWIRKMYSENILTPLDVVEEIIKRNGNYADYNILIM